MGAGAHERADIRRASLSLARRSAGAGHDMRRPAPGGRSSTQNKYPSASSPIRIASGAEARLIIAEADIAAGTAASLQNAAAIIDTFRARGNQPPLSASDPATLRAALIDQRRRELFLEGQHLGDIIRFGVTLTPAAGTRLPRRRRVRLAEVPRPARRRAPEQPGAPRLTPRERACPLSGCRACRDQGMRARTPKPARHPR